jgi:putative ABC transport system ATP-binding protein
MKNNKFLTKLSNKYQALKQRRKEKLELRKQFREIEKANNTPRQTIPEIKSNIAIKVFNLTKKYISGDEINTVLDKISFEIPRGKVTTILGVSGVGKTTLLNIIAGIERGTEGDVFVDSVNLSSLTEKELTKYRANSLGVVFQKDNLISSINVSENCRLSQGLQKDKSKRIHLYELFEELAIMDQKHKKPFQISGGQKQRTSICRALTKRPTILLTDEPTSALDTNNSKAVINLLLKVTKKYNITTIIVSHDKRVAMASDIVLKMTSSGINLIDQKNTKITVDEAFKLT